MSIDDKELEEFMPDLELEWTDEAQTRMKNVPFFVRKSVVRGIEQYAKDKSLAVVDGAQPWKWPAKRRKPNSKLLLMEKSFNGNTLVSPSINSTLCFAGCPRKNASGA